MTEHTTLERSMNVVLAVFLSVLIKSSLSCSPAPTQPAKKPPHPSQYSTPAPPNATASACGHNIYYNSVETFGAGIVGGFDARRNEFPWQVRLQITSGADKFLCGATVINTRWIVTAAHCVKVAAGPDSIIAVFGDHDRGAIDFGEFTVGISQILFHPDSNSSTLPFDYDISMLKLQDPITYSNTTQPICLPTNCGTSACQNGSTAWISGWGTDDGRSTSAAYILQKAWVPIVTNSQCASAYASVDATITDGMICAGFEDGGVDSCRGDSGGPLICNNAGFWELGGITSFGSAGCAEKGFYGVYAKICQYVDWIKTTSAIV